MKTAKDFLTPEQMAIPLNQTAYDPGDSCLGGDLDAELRKRNESLIDVTAKFAYEENYEIDAETQESKVVGERMYIRHFMAWSETQIYVVLRSGFGDEYLASIPRNPVNCVVTIDED